MKKHYKTFETLSSVSFVWTYIGDAAMDFFEKEFLKTIPASFIASLIKFILVATFVSKYFEMSTWFLIKVLIGYYIFNYLVSSVINWIVFILISKRTMVFLCESIIHKCYDSL